jgi:hypothetical protein
MELQCMDLCNRSFDEMKILMNDVCEKWPTDCKEGEKLTKQRAFRKCLVILEYPLMASNQTPYRRLISELTKGLNWAFSNDPSPKPDLTMREHKTDDASQQSQVNLPNFNSQMLEINGIYRIAKVFNKRTVNALRDIVKRAFEDNTSKLKWLADSAGNGKNGVYFYINPTKYKTNKNEANALKMLQQKLAERFYQKNTDEYKKAMNSRMIALGYGENGENWTHQDQSRTSKYQALVLLSIPGVDFNGGELFVQNGKIPKTNAPTIDQISNFASGGSAGDVVVFKANNVDGGIDFYHGMTTVKKGVNDNCERWCIGLFQPPETTSSGSKRKSK